MKRLGLLLLLPLLIPAVAGTHVANGSGDGYSILGIWQENVSGELTTGPGLVLVEMFTASWCAVCARVDPIVDELQISEPGVILLKYHPFPDFEDPLGVDGNSQRQFDLYRSTSFPHVVVGGRWEHAGAPPLLGNPYRDAVNYMRIEQPTASFIGSIELTGSTLRVDLEVTVSDPANLFVLVVERQVEFAGSNGITDHHRTVRAWLVNESISGTMDRELEVELDPSWSGPDLSVVAFVQEDPGRLRDLSAVGFSFTPMWYVAILTVIAAGLIVLRPHRTTPTTKLPPEWSRLGEE